MHSYYREASVEDAIHVAKNLQPADRLEIEGLGHHPLMLPLYVKLSDPAVTFLDTDGALAGIAGIQDEGNGVGRIWMLCTPVLSRKPTKFIRGAKRWLSEQQPRFDLLYNVVDQRNTFHHKLLKMLGFKTLRQVNLGPNFLPYLEIIRLCV